MKALALLAALTAAWGEDSGEWRVYGGSAGSTRYSALKQINRGNVKSLRVAWTFETGDSFPNSEMQCNPLMVGRTVYVTSPRLRVFALDAATGGMRWVFDPNEGVRTNRKSRNRGLTYWDSGPDRRIFVVSGYWLWALEAGTGKPVGGFGRGGRVDLREGLGRDVTGQTISATTPGAVYKDLLILGSIVSEGLPAAPGHIRAFDARTGAIRWIFHTIPHPGEFGYETWGKDNWKTSGAANNWAGMSVDARRGLVFVPTGSAAFDFYGGDRPGDNLFANTLLALDAGTGKRVWHFQAVRHDVWDRDFPAPPSLVTALRDGRLVDAVAQTTKSGHLFLFERETGKPLFPIEERAAPASDVPGEILAKKQPLPLKPAPFARQIFTEEMATRRTPEANRAVRARLRQVRSEGQFTPPGFGGTVVFPGFDGGAEWGGAAFDPETRILYVNSNEMAWILRIVEKPAPKGDVKNLYLRHCASCHREDLRGSPPEFPSLDGIGARRRQADIRSVIARGAGRMPGFAQLGAEAVDALASYVVTRKDQAVRAGGSIPDLRYTHDGYNKFLDPDGYPAVEPPWGTLNAIRLDDGEYAWKIPLGEIPELAAKGLRNTGSENYGGPLVTAGGLLFIGATNHDRKFRAFDKADGRLLWEATLPAAGNATPATYEADGRQFVVIGAGGGKSGQPSGGSYVAFALDK